MSNVNNVMAEEEEQVPADQQAQDEEQASAEELALAAALEGRNLIRSYESTELTPAELAERSIIPYTEGADWNVVNAFRELSTRLLAMFNENFVALVAPVSERCGGSYVARNLALSVTFDLSKTALLVDCNLRKPAQHLSQHMAMKVGIPNGGLLDYLRNPEAEVDDMVYSTGIPRFNLIPAGHASLVDMEPEYFSSFRMRLLIDSLRGSYTDRYVFLDSAPVLGSPDARLLADMADIVVLVAGYGRNTPDEISAAAAQFDPRKFAGVVFNENL